LDVEDEAVVLVAADVDVVVVDADVSVDDILS
jgi:hypothetical protein